MNDTTRLLEQAREALRSFPLAAIAMCDEARGKYASASHPFNDKFGDHPEKLEVARGQAEACRDLSEAIRREAIKSLDRLWKDITAHLSARPTPAQPAGEPTKKLKHPLYWFNQSTGEMLAGDYVSVHGPLPERDSTWIALDERAAGEPAAPQAAAWYEGAPPFPQDQEWFIAETTYGDRVVLRSLDDGRAHRGNYAFHTADGTYLKAEVVKRWMQFPDCEYLPPATQPKGERLGTCSTCHGSSGTYEVFPDNPERVPFVQCPECGGKGEGTAPQAAAQPVAEARVRGWHGKNVSLKTQKNGKVRLVLDLDAVEIAAAYWVTCSPAGGKCPTKKGCAAYGCHGACLDVTDYTATPGEKAALRRRIERIGLATTPSKGEGTTPAAWPAGLLDRVRSAEQRIRDNHAPRRIPADPTDVDLVLAEVRMLIEGKAPPFWLASPQQDDRMALDEAIRDALSVCLSVSTSHDRRVVRDGGVLYLQTAEWCEWLEKEVKPKLEAALSSLTPPAAQAPSSTQAAPEEVQPAKWTKEKIIAFVEAAGIRWIPPEADEERGFPGGFDMCTLSEMGRLLAAAAPAPADNWQQYAKEGETAQTCIERHRKEHDGLLSLLAKARSAAPEAPSNTTRAACDMDKVDTAPPLGAHASQAQHRPDDKDQSPRPQSGTDGEVR